MMMIMLTILELTVKLSSVWWSGSWGKHGDRKSAIFSVLSASNILGGDGHLAVTSVLARLYETIAWLHCGKRRFLRQCEVAVIEYQLLRCNSTKIFPVQYSKIFRGYLLDCNALSLFILGLQNHRYLSPHTVTRRNVFPYCHTLRIGSGTTGRPICHHAVYQPFPC